MANNTKISTTTGGVLLAIIGIIVLLNFASNDGKSNYSTQLISNTATENTIDTNYQPKTYKITETGYYCAFTKDDFDLLIDMQNSKDYTAIGEMTLDGRIIRLEKGQEASMVSYGFINAKIRLKGSTLPCWAKIEAIN